MKVFNAAYRSVVVGGTLYTADADGAIDLPDNLIHPGIWAMGFVQVKPKPDASLSEGQKLTATGLETPGIPVDEATDPEADTPAGQDAESVSDGGTPKATNKPSKATKAAHAS